MNPETQPLLQHEVPQMRALLPLPLVLTLILLPIFLLPQLFKGPTSEERPPPTQNLRASTRNDTLRLLSLNMFIRPRFIGWSDFKDERLEDLFQVFKTRDLLCLQELFWTTGRRKRDFLDRISPHLHYSAHAPKPGMDAWLQYPPKPIDAGLVILSTRRIVDTRFHMFTTSAWNSVDYFVAKGVLYAGIHAASGVVHVFTTHMQAGNYAEIRKQQAAELVEFVKSVVKDDEVIVIAGDFNTNGRRGFDDEGESVEYKRLMNKMKTIGVVDVVKRSLGQVVTTAGGLWGSTQKNERIDYLFLRRGADGLVASIPRDGVRVEELRVEGKDYETMSDHYGIVAEIVLGLG